MEENLGEANLNYPWKKVLVYGHGYELVHGHGPEAISCFGAVFLQGMQVLPDTAIHS